jgi:hypothetical protein
MEPTTLPDPNVSTLDKLYSSGAFFCLGILVLFFVVRYLTKHWAWLREGQRHVWAVAFLGGLATLVVPATQGTTPNASMLVAVAITIGSILVDPKKVAAISSALVVFLLLFASMASGCSWLKKEAHEVKQAIVDCTKGERAKLVDEFKPTVQAILDAAVSRARDEQPTTTEGLHPVARSERVPCGMLSGCTQFSGEIALAEPLGIDWRKVAAETKDKLRSLGKETGACVAAEVFAGWIGAKRTFATYEVAPEAARDGFNVLRAELWPGETYHTRAGNL